MCRACRQLSFSSPRLFDHDHDELFPAGASLSSHRPCGFYSTSCERLNSWQPGLTANVHASSVDTLSDVDTRWHQSSTDGNVTRHTRDCGFYSDQMAPTIASTTSVQPAVRELSPVFLRHSNLHNSSDFLSSPFPNLDRTFSE